MSKAATFLIFLALWTAPGRAVVSWDAPGRACLFRNATFINCWDGPQAIPLEGGDFAYHPAAGDVFTLQFPDGSIVQTRLRPPTVYLPIALK